MTFSKGVKDGLPIGVGYFAVSFAFGINAGAALQSWFLATFISMTNVTSAGQFAGLKIMASATGTLVEMAVASLFINLRYSLMAISLSQKVSPSFGTAKRLLLATGITDEIYAVAMSQSERVNPLYFLGLMTLPYLGWSGGTLTGAVCGQILPDIVVNALGVALYGMFIAIVVPPMKSSRPVLIAVLIAIVMSLGFFYLPVLNSVSSGFAIITCAVVASLLCAALFPVKDAETAGGEK
ncbi:MAG: AzlC family ABC transporter permease [Fibrobacter sp.]|nr:AzlC family ABC transporter permease [Fibrobacter sp.]